MRNLGKTTQKVGGFNPKTDHLITLGVLQDVWNKKWKTYEFNEVKKEYILPEIGMEILYQNEIYLFFYGIY